MRFFTELGALGVRNAVVSPGSRSTPLVLSAHAAGLDVSVQIDERVAAFHALGLAKAARMPVVLVCSSGTAGANYHPAIIEAHHSGVPLIVCTADRPPELRQWGAGQTIDQVNLFGTSVRWFFDMPVASEVSETRGSAAALRAVETAVGEGGPVHINWPFREPLEPDAPLPILEARSVRAGAPVRSAPSARLHELGAAHREGIIVVGPEDLDLLTASEIMTFAEHYRWPVLADPGSGMRAGPAPSPLLITTGELLLADPQFASRLARCDVVVRVGLAPTSKAYRRWVESDPPCQLVLIGVGADWGDPTATVTEVIGGPVPGMFAEHPDQGVRQVDGPWSRLWTEADAIVTDTVGAVLDGDEGELGVTKSLVDHLASDPKPANLLCSNSMPVRNLEFAMRPTGSPLRVLLSRGANGIDGIVATGLGVACADPDRHTWVLIGDVAAVHDLGGLAAAARSGLDNLTVVIVDNGGGGIFSILPIARAIDADVFTELFSTPHGTDFASLGEALGLSVTELNRWDRWPETDDSEGVARLIIVKTTIAMMTSGVATLRAEVAAALSRRGGADLAER
jgi:2-succinyl-5-enolpyruvyl-6-hydroxy-3-cyclohexene-1-carboxylate synthase